MKVHIQKPTYRLHGEKGRDMKKYKSAIVVQREEKRICIIPYVKSKCGDTENIEFIVSVTDGTKPIQGKAYEDMSEIISMIQDMIYDSVLED